MQVLVTTVKIAGIVGLVAGAFLFAAPAVAVSVVPAPETVGIATTSGSDLLALFRFAGLGVAAVLFTYDGWIDVSHVAGEVRRPERDLPLGMAIGVGALTLLYVVVNIAYLRVVPLEASSSARCRRSRR